MEVKGKVYEVGRHSEITNLREDAKCDIHGRTQKGDESYLPVNSEKGCTGKLKKSYADHRINCLNGDKTRLLHEPGHSLEEFKVRSDYFNKYGLQWYNTEYRYNGKN